MLRYKVVLLRKKPQASVITYITKINIVTNSYI